MAEFDIPDPPIPDSRSVIYEKSLGEAVFEQRQLSSWLSPKAREGYDWFMCFILKPVLFSFVLGISTWWICDVSGIVWQSGRSGSGFHLNDSVLIALITTSIANFLALVTIIAKNLFPDGQKTEDSN
jgi:hypothetical protein